MQYFVSFCYLYIITPVLSFSNFPDKDCEVHLTNLFPKNTVNFMEAFIFQSSYKIMSTADIKAEILKQIEAADDKLLRMVHAMIEAYNTDEDPVISYDVHGNPRRASELKALLDKEVQEVRKGNYITLEELEEKSKQWIKPTE